MVEAAGIEPASEKVRREMTTCVSGSLVVGGRHQKPAKSDCRLARLISTLGSGPKPEAYSAI